MFDLIECISKKLNTEVHKNIFYALPVVTILSIISLYIIDATTNIHFPFYGFWGYVVIFIAFIALMVRYKLENSTILITISAISIVFSIVKYGIISYNGYNLNHHTITIFDYDIKFVFSLFFSDKKILPY